MHRLYLHVGMMKTGTTYLQNVWRANHEELADQGVYYPVAPGSPAQRFAVWDFLGRQPRGADDGRTAGQWAALTAAVSERADRTVLLSEESLASVSVRRARRAVAAFPDHEVHVVVTARDLGRVLSSAWQEDVKSGAAYTWPEFIAAVRDPDALTRDPARGFWLRHDLPAVVETWAEAAGADRVHVVTVPPEGSEPGLLLARMGGLVGFDPARLTAPVARGNTSIGTSGTEVVRRLNERLGGRLNQRQYDWVVKNTVEQDPPSTTAADRMVLPAEHLAWATEQAERMVGRLERGGYDVVGGLDELRPQAPQGGRSPDEVSDEELLDSALHVLTVLAERHAKLWWRNRRSDQPGTAAGSVAVRASSGLRGAAYRVRRKGADLSDRNRVAAAAMAIYLRTRGRGTAR